MTNVPQPVYGTVQPYNSLSTVSSEIVNGHLNVVMCSHPHQIKKLEPYSGNDYMTTPATIKLILSE